NPQEVTLQMLRPRFTWIEVQPPPEVRTRYSQRWGYQVGYPAAAWSIDVPAWPARPGTNEPSRPLLRVWWNPEQETVPAAALERGADFQRLADIGARPLLVANTEVRIETATIEERFVQTAPGKVETKSCLVLRLRQPGTQPIWARVRGLNLEGQE